MIRIYPRESWKLSKNYFNSILTLVLLNLDIPCLCKQCRSRSVGFWRSQLIWICTVCHYVCKFIATTKIKQSDWLKIRNGCGILVYSAWQGLNCLPTIYILNIWTLTLLGFNDTSTLVGHFVSSLREREKKYRRDSRGDEWEGRGERGKWMKVKKQKK